MCFQTQKLLLIYNMFDLTGQIFYILKIQMLEGMFTSGMQLV